MRPGTAYKRVVGGSIPSAPTHHPWPVRSGATGPSSSMPLRHTTTARQRGTPRPANSDGSVFGRTKCLRPAAEPVHLSAGIIDAQSSDPGWHRVLVVMFADQQGPSR